MLPPTPRPAPTADLWARLEAFDLDAIGATLPFSQRLARDNGWSPAFAHRVVHEYKRFLFLAATCDHPVTPSDEVDQAWHLHLVYTRSYWDELCGQVLGFALHHGPTRGGVAEGRKFDDWYARTLQSYQGAFNTLPPADIWPAAAQRFGDAPYFRRVNLRRHWLLPRLRWPKVRSGHREVLGLAAALLLLGCTARTPLNPFDWYGTEFLMLFGALCVVLLPLSLWFRRRLAGPAEPYFGPPLSTYEVARLAGNGRRVAESAIAALVHTGRAELLPEYRIRRTAAVPPLDPYERAVWNLMIPSAYTNLDKLRTQAASPVIGALKTLDATLESRGLVLPAAERARLNRVPLLVGLGLGAFGLAKLLVGLNRGRPVGYLLFMLVVLIQVVIWLRRGTTEWATGRGRRLLAELEPAVRAAQSQPQPASAETVALAVALFGVGELTGFGYGTLQTYLKTPLNSGGSSGGDGGSGCGGGGCGGGGCGGCGGCGS